MSGRPVKSPGLLGSLISIASPNVLVVDVESAEVTKTGSWTVVSDADAVGSSYRERAVTNDVLSFSFEGSALWIRFKLGPDCGIATVTLDGTAADVDLYNALDAYKYVSVAVGLDETASHSVTIQVKGTKNPSSTDYKVKVDAYTYRLTEEALSLHAIEYLDLINVINTINKIGQISQIDNITTLGTVNDVKKIDDITLIDTITTINQILYAGLKPLIFANGGFETGDFSGYFSYTSYTTIDATVHHFGKYSCKMTPAAIPAGGIWQRIPRCYGDEITITWQGISEHDGDKIEAYVRYADGTVELADVNTFTFWNDATFSPTTHKIVDCIVFCVPTPPPTNVGNVWVDDINVEGILLSHVSKVENLLNPHPVSLSGALPTGTNSIGYLSQSTKHDAKTYIYTFGDIAATGLLNLAKASGKVIKLHFYSLQTTVDGVTVYFYEETSTTQLSKKWVLNAREGQESPFVTAPANLPKCATQNMDMGINISGGASPHIYWEIIYSVDDAS